MAEHLLHIKKVFEKLQSAKFSMKVSKCHFLSKEMQYLGHILSTKGICPLPLKTQAIQKMCKAQTNIFTQVRGLLYKHVTDSGQKFLALVILKS